MDIASVLVETAAFQVGEPQATAIKHDIPREKPAPLSVLHQQTTRIRSMSSCADSTKANAVQRDLLSVGEQFVWVAWACNKTSWIASEFEVDSNGTIAVDILHSLLGPGRRPDHRARSFPKLVRAAPVSDMR